MERVERARYCFVLLWVGSVREEEGRVESVPW
jgi:hypothetical protein